MSKTATLKKTLALLSMGGATFFFGFSLPGAPGCVTNGNLVAFYQTVGDEGIAAFQDSTSNLLNQAFGTNFPPSDFDKIVIEPVGAFWTAMWDNKVASDFPLDVGVAGDWLQ